MKTVAKAGCCSLRLGVPFATESPCLFEVSILLAMANVKTTTKASSAASSAKSRTGGKNLPSLRRQRLLVMFIEHEGRIAKRDLQKLLFLYMQELGRRDYSFVPFKHGCYSFQSKRDLDLLEEQGWIRSENDEWCTAGESPVQHGSENADSEALRKWLSKHPWRGETLVAYTYRNFPYFASRSEIAETLRERGFLKESDMLSIRSAKPDSRSADQTVFSVGYEGRSIDCYVNTLIENDITLVCDVRKNPISRKYGFSKTTMKDLLGVMSIEYRHLPELGINSEKRRHLASEQDYSSLFLEYKRSLSEKLQPLAEIEKMLQEHKRIAITCFEAEHSRCHRQHVISEINTRGYKQAML